MKHWKLYKNFPLQPLFFSLVNTLQLPLTESAALIILEKCMQEKMYASAPSAHLAHTHICTRTSSMHRRRLLEPLIPITQPSKHNSQCHWLSPSGEYSLPLLSWKQQKSRDWIGSGSVSPLFFFLLKKRSESKLRRVIKRGGLLTRGLSLRRVWCLIKKAEEENPGFKSECMCVCVVDIDHGYVCAYSICGCAHSNHVLSTSLGLWLIVEPGCSEAILSIYEWLMKKC